AITAVDGGGVVFQSPDHPIPTVVHGTPAITQAVLIPDFSSDGRLAYTADESHGIYVWDATTGALLRHIAVPGQVSSIAADPQGIVVGLADGHVDFVDPATGAGRDGFVAGSTWPGAIKRSPDRTMFGVAEDDGVALMDAKTGARVRLLATGGVHMIGLAFSPDGSRVAGGGADGT